VERFKVGDLVRDPAGDDLALVVAVGPVTGHISIQWLQPPYLTENYAHNWLEIVSAAKEMKKNC